MSKASDVMIGGCSAGGLATYFHGTYIVYGLLILHLVQASIYVRNTCIIIIFIFIFIFIAIALIIIVIIAIISSIDTQRQSIFMLFRNIRLNLKSHKCSFTQR